MLNILVKQRNNLIYYWIESLQTCEMRGYHGRKIAYKLRYVIITCRILYRAIYDDMERKTGVAQDTARKIAMYAIEQKRYEDIHDVFA